MRTSETITLPIATAEQVSDQTLRRAIEQAFQDLRLDMVEVRDKTDKASSLAMRRHQFLLMGG